MPPSFRSRRSTPPTTRLQRAAIHPLGTANAGRVSLRRQGLLASDRTSNPPRVAVEGPARGTRARSRGQAQPVCEPSRPGRSGRGMAPVRGSAPTASRCRQARLNPFSVSPVVRPAGLQPRGPRRAARAPRRLQDCGRIPLARMDRRSAGSKAHACAACGPRAGVRGG